MTRSKRTAIWLVTATLAGVIGFTVTRSRADESAPPAGAIRRDSGSATAPGGRPPATAAPDAPLHLDDDDDVALPPDPLSLPPTYHPRAEGEWQGMRVELSSQALCSAESACGLAMACKAGKCGPCASDDECGSGEACVLDHCLRADLVTCRGRADCPGEGALCVLSGYSEGVRGNADLRSSCLVPTGGMLPVEDEESPVPVTEPAQPAPLEARELLDEVEAHAAQPR